MTDKPMIAALTGTACNPPPVWFMRQAGRYLPEYRAVRAQAGGFLDLCYNPERATAVTLQPVHRYGVDAAILFSDILVVPHGLGQTVWFEDGEGPKLSPIRSAADIAGLAIDRLAPTLAPVYDAVRQIAGALDPATALIGFAGAPWTVASYMIEGGSSRDYVVAKTFAARDPDGFQTLLRLVTDATVRHLSAQVDAGAEVVQIFDSWAGALTPPQLIAWSYEPIADIVARMTTAHPDVPVIVFPRGAGQDYARFAAMPGISGISLDTTIDPAWAAAVFPPRLAIQGNLDPVSLMVGGDHLDGEVRRIREAVRGRAHIFNLGHGIDKRTPPDNVARALAILREPS